MKSTRSTTYTAARALRSASAEVFVNFYADMGPCPFPKGSIERRNNSLGYEPSNCEWLPKRDQSKTRDIVHRVEYDGKTLTFEEWGKLMNVAPHTL